MFGARYGSYFLDFIRQGRSFREVVDDAIAQVRSARLPLDVVRVEPGDWVTVAEIARRTDKSREAVRLWVNGQRGPGDFPPPRMGLTEGTTLWSWRDVARWLDAQGLLPHAALREEAESRFEINEALAQYGATNLSPDAPTRR